MTFRISPALTVPSFGTSIRTLDVLALLSAKCSTLPNVPSLSVSLMKVTVGAPGIITGSAPVPPSAYPPIGLSYDSKALFVSVKFL